MAGSSAPAESRPSSESEGTFWRPADLPNTFTHRPVNRQLVTGAHTVSDISCRACGSVVGWKYVHAEEEAQQYKVGKFILETKRVVKEGGWEADLDGHGDGDADGNEIGGFDEVEELGGVGAPRQRDEEIEFDSQDEDECEDLFSGMWSPELARRRRRNKDFRR